jgi:hypothetical protein
MLSRFLRVVWCGRKNIYSWTSRQGYLGLNLFGIGHSRCPSFSLPILSIGHGPDMNYISGNNGLDLFGIGSDNGLDLFGIGSDNHLDWIGIGSGRGRLTHQWRIGHKHSLSLLLNRFLHQDLVIGIRTGVGNGLVLLHPAGHLQIMCPGSMPRDVIYLLVPNTIVQDNGLCAIL